jgi:processive 1,2-diacylglycerol beta-glucosyltransferase
MQASHKRNILILSGDFGDGHKQAARAICDAIGLQENAVRAEVVDFMEWTHPRLHAVSRYCYLQWVTHFPSIYGYLFQKTRGDNSFSQLFKKLKLFSMARMLQLLHEKKPDIVVSTFPSAAAAMSALKTYGLTSVPTVTVMTDHTDHSYWVHPYTDRYIVGSGHVRDGLLRQHVPDSLISVTGIPIRLPFSESFDKVSLRLRHGLDPAMPTVLVMGGGLGMIGKDVAGLLRGDRIGRALQVVFVCGSNGKLAAQLSGHVRESRHKIRILGYVDYVHELMALADVIVTKPGGLTTSEAIASELPMLLYKPLPGQEKDNADFLVQAGLALEAADSDELENLLTNVFQNPQILTTIKDRARQFQMKSATRKAIAAIIGTSGAAHPAAPLRQAAFARG